MFAFQVNVEFPATTTRVFAGVAGDQIPRTVFECKQVITIAYHHEFVI